MPYLLDSDAAKKLCQYELIADLAIALGVTLSEFIILPQLKFQLHANNPTKGIQKLGSAEAFAQLQLLVSQASEVVISARGGELIVRLDRPDIQTGEQVLLASLIDDESSELLTGDKRALAALSRLEDPLATVALWARIICLEEAFVILVENGCFETLSSKVRALPEVDTAISIIFGRSSPAGRSQVLEGLASYLRDLRQQTGGAYQVG